MIYQPFVLLVHKLGFHLPDDTNRSWIRVPNVWDADLLLKTAEKLGPIDETLFKFDFAILNYQPQKGQPIITKLNKKVCEPFITRSHTPPSSHIR